MESLFPMLYMGRFHKQGFAQEFEVTGHLYRTILWGKGIGPRTITGQDEGAYNSWGN